MYEAFNTIVVFFLLLISQIGQVNPNGANIMQDFFSFCGKNEAVRRI